MGMATLICDDSAMVRKQILRALPKDWEGPITQASNGREAIEAISAGRGEVTFLDLTMPEMDGFEVLETLRQNGIRKTIIVVSADIQPQAQSRVLALGAIAFVRKPVDGERIRETMRACGLIPG